MEFVRYSLWFPVLCQATKVANGETARASEALAKVARRAAIKAAGWKVVISYLQTLGFNLGGGLFLRLDP
jgi:hypothetical protein